MQENSLSQVNRVKEGFRSFWRTHESGIIVITILYAVFVQTINPRFLSAININNFLRQTGYILIPAIGMTLVLIAGGLDLSVGSGMALAGIVAGFGMENYGLPVYVSVLLGLAAGLAVGLVNGLIIVRFSVPPMIITLGMMYIARGIVMVTTSGVAIYPLPDSFQNLEQGRIFGLPTVVPFCLLICVLFHVILTQTTFGRAIYAIGGNRDTAKLSGIRVNRITLVVYAICGMMAALSGLVISSRLGSAQPSAGTG
ncbi:MAG: ABC transporter permease, partial [Synergistaceae bacterium]|nr:ABC transporter permease [Synergistaceae bacterium]